MYDSKYQNDMTKSVESKDQPVILTAITLYQKVFVIVEIVGSYSKCLKVSERYDDDNVLYHYNAPVTKMNMLIKIQLTLIRITPYLVEFTNQLQNIVNMVCGFHWITGCQTVYHV